MDATRPVSILIGEGAIAVNCANALLRANYDLRLVCSTDPDLLKWADEHQVPAAEELSAVTALVDAEGCDYLFSIVNFRIIPAALLHAPRKMAINYHDGPLPRYGGSFVTSWAILNGEKEHGVTWHVMAERVDAGDILKQVMFAVDEKETAATLNAKCHFAAVRSFRALLGELSAGTATRTPQDMSQRTFFGRSKKPTPDCIAPLYWSADQIDSFVRALNNGPTPSPIGVAKVVLNGLVFSVTEVLKGPDALGAPPGTVYEQIEGRAHVATGTTDIIVAGLRLLTPV